MSDPRPCLPIRPRTNPWMFVVLMAMTLVLSSCQKAPTQISTNHWCIVTRDDQPESVYQDDVCWVARKMGDGRWVYLPSAVAEVLDTVEWNPAGVILEIVVKDRLWKLYRASNACGVEAPWEQTAGTNFPLGDQRTTDSLWGVIWILTGALGISLVCLIACLTRMNSAIRDLAMTRHAKSMAEANLEKERWQVKELACNHAQELQAAAQERDQTIAEHAGEIERVRHEEQSKVQEADRLMKLAEALKAGDNAEAVDAILRGLITNGISCGQFVTVKYLMSSTGRVGLEWAIHGPVVEEAKVVVKLDGQVLTTHCGAEGRFGCQLRRGEVYKFIFDVLNGQRTVERDVMLTLRVPTEREWSRTPNSPETNASGGTMKDETRRRRDFLM